MKVKNGKLLQMDTAELEKRIERIKTSVLSSRTQLYHFDHITGNLACGLSLNAEFAKQSQSARDVCMQCRDNLTTYLDLVEKYPDFKKGEFFSKNGYFEEAPTASDMYVKYAARELEAQTNFNYVEWYGALVSSFYKMLFPGITYALSNDLVSKNYYLRWTATHYDYLS